MTNVNTSAEAVTFNRFTIDAAKEILAMAVEILQNPVEFKHLPCNAADTHFVDRRCFPMVRAITTEVNGRMVTLNVYAMRTQSKHRGVINGIAIYVKDFGHYYLEEVGMDFDRLVELVQEANFLDYQTSVERREANATALTQWLASDAFPPYTENMAAEKASLF
jgi:hypothetical protein